MKIGIPVARFHPGNTGEYAQRAFQALGHSASVLNVQEFFSALRGTEFDYFFCVDSSEPIPLTDAAIADCSLARVGFWFIDFRHNKNRPTRIPNDLNNARTLHERGGWIFQSQFEDYEDCRGLGWDRLSWLPLAADEEVWTPEPVVPKEFHIGFVGNVFDVQRHRALHLLHRSRDLRVGFLGQGAIWKEEAAGLMRKCTVGFNIVSFLGEAIAYDVNMRTFETLSCGVPLFTNDVPSLKRIFPSNALFIRTYSSISDLMPNLIEAFKSQSFLNSGEDARRWIVDNATYKHRMKDVISLIQRAS